MLSWRTAFSFGFRLEIQTHSLSKGRSGTCRQDQCKPRRGGHYPHRPHKTGSRGTDGERTHTKDRRGYKLDFLCLGPWETVGRHHKIFPRKRWCFALRSFYRQFNSYSKKKQQKGGLVSFKMLILIMLWKCVCGKSTHQERGGKKQSFLQQRTWPSTWWPIFLLSGSYTL